MNSFYVPALAGMIYAMPGMETKLHAVINQPGDYEGFSANYSGAGFSGMRFKFHGHVATATSTSWVETNRESGQRRSTRDAYLELEKPSEREPVRRYGKVDAGLYEAVLNRCVDGGKMCMNEMMAIDAAGGTGKGGVAGLTPAPRKRRAAAHRRRRPVHRRQPPRPAAARAGHRRPQLSTAARAHVLTEADLRPPELGGDPLSRADPARHLRRGRRWAASRCSALLTNTACGARCGATGSPASTTRRSASCTWCWAS